MCLWFGRCKLYNSSYPPQLAGWALKPPALVIKHPGIVGSSPLLEETPVSQSRNSPTTEMQSQFGLFLFSLVVLTGKITATPIPQFGSHLGECNAKCSYPNMQFICSYPRLYCAMPGNFVIEDIGTCDLCSVYQPVVPYVSPEYLLMTFS